MEPAYKAGPISSTLSWRNWRKSQNISVKIGVWSSMNCNRCWTWTADNETRNSHRNLRGKPRGQQLKRSSNTNQGIKINIRGTDHEDMVWNKLAPNFIQLHFAVEVLNTRIQINSYTVRVFLYRIRPSVERIKSIWRKWLCYMQNCSWINHT